MEAPATGAVGELMEIPVQFTVFNSCGEFNRFIESGTETERIIEVEALYEGCVCNEVIETIVATYEFRPESAGDYELNFRSGVNDFITVNIAIDQPTD